MSSLLTNASAMTALQTLQSTNKNLATTQNRIATGERVSSAADNAAYWSISTGMKAQNASLSAVQDTLGLGAGVVDTAYTALTEAIDLTKEIQAKFVAYDQLGDAATETDEGTLILGEINALKAQVIEIASAEFQGVNLLSADAGADTNFDVVIGLGGDGTTTKLNVESYNLLGALGAEGSVLTGALVATALSEMTAAAADLGAAKIRIDSQQRFTGKLMDAIDRGVGQLVDADMNAESARLSALQTQQQLGIQALSIANQSSQNILSLFR